MKICWRRVFQYNGQSWRYTQLQPIVERIECEERVCDHTGQCGGVGSGDVANLRIGDHSITVITILHSHNDTELKYKWDIEQWIHLVLRDYSVRRVCDHTGQCGGDGVTNIWLRHHTCIVESWSHCIWGNHTTGTIVIVRGSHIDIK